MLLSPSEVYAARPYRYFAVCLMFTSYYVIVGFGLLPAGGGK